MFLFNIFTVKMKDLIYIKDNGKLTPYTRLKELLRSENLERIYTTVVRHLQKEDVFKFDNLIITKTKLQHGKRRKF